MIGVIAQCIIAVSGFAAAFLLMYGLKRMSSPATAASGIRVAGAGMLGAVVGAYFYAFDVDAAAKPHLLVNLGLAIVAMGIGGFIAGRVGKTVKITANFSTKGVFESGSLEVDGSLQPWNRPTLGTSPKGYQNALTWPGCGSKCGTWQNNGIPSTRLFSALLTGVSVDSKDEALGFTTADFSGWADQKIFTNGDAESLWLYAICSNQPNCGLPGGGLSAGSKYFNGNGTGYGWAASQANAAWNAFLSEVASHSKLEGNTFYDISSIATVPVPGGVWLLFSGLGGLGGLELLRRRRPANAPAVSV